MGNGGFVGLELGSAPAPGCTSLCQLCPSPEGDGVMKRREGRSETHLKRSFGPFTCPKASAALRNERFHQRVVEDLQ